MSTLDLLKSHRQKIRVLVNQHNARNPSVFGSVLKGTDHADSDIDILVEPLPDMSLFDLGAIQFELSALLGKRVDVLTPDALPERFRQDVISQAEFL